MGIFNFNALLAEMAPVAAEGAHVRDKEAEFVFENYVLLKENGAFAALVPSAYGGGGGKYSELANFIRLLATYSPATALAFSMHQHLIAAAVFNDRHGKPGRKVLDAVAQKKLILVSTGANDWLQSNGQIEKVENGFRVTAIKPFASGSPAAQVMITSAPYQDPDKGWQVLHFPVPLSAEGVSFGGDWDTLGMRETGSQSIHLKNVFVPEDAIAVKRPRDGYHPAYNVILTVALPLIMSAYVGGAEKAVEIALSRAQNNKEDEALPYLVGDMLNKQTMAQIGLQSMVSLVAELEFDASTVLASEMLCRKTIVSNAVLASTEAALKVSGGAGFFAKFGLEKLLRDVHAAQFHPLPEIHQQRFTGGLALGLEPV